MILTFGDTTVIQRVVQNIIQGKIQKLISDNYMIKVISLIFAESGTQTKVIKIKPYIYQMHLWQILNACIQSSGRLAPMEDKRCVTLISNVFFILNLQLKKIGESSGESRQAYN